MPLNHTDKATLAGLYLSKYDRKALAALECSGVWQAFNILGYSLGVGPASIKNYRDEFDHEIRKTNPNHPREGWKRPLKTRSKVLFERFSSLDFDSFTDMVKGFLLPSFKKEQLVAHVTKQFASLNLAQRLMTGQAAEGYFKAQCSFIPEFNDFGLEDVTSCGCGYDFHLSRSSDFYCVEVKGLSLNSGSISMTENEYTVAGEVKDRYCLFVVRNFQAKPSHSLFFNPTKSNLTFKPQQKTVTSYLAYV